MEGGGLGKGEGGVGMRVAVHMRPAESSTSHDNMHPLEAILVSPLPFPSIQFPLPECMHVVIPEKVAPDNAEREREVQRRPR